MRLTLGLTVGLVVVLSLVLSSHAILCLSGSLAQISSLLVIYLISPETGSARPDQYKLPLLSIYNFTSVKIAHNNFVSIGKLAQIVVCGTSVCRDNHFSYYFHQIDKIERRESWE